MQRGKKKKKFNSFKIVTVGKLLWYKIIKHIGMHPAPLLWIVCYYKCIPLNVVFFAYMM